jgi:hypothetical protein
MQRKLNAHRSSVLTNVLVYLGIHIIDDADLQLHSYFFLSVRIIYEAYTNTVVYSPPVNPFVNFILQLQQMRCDFHVSILWKSKRVFCRCMKNLSTELICWMY